LNEFYRDESHFKFNNFCSIYLKICKMTNVHIALLRAFQLYQKQSKGPNYYSMVTSKWTWLENTYLNILIVYGVENFKTQKVDFYFSMIFHFCNFIFEWYFSIIIIIKTHTHTHTHTYSNIDNEEKYVNFVAIVENWERNSACQILSLMSSLSLST
jgi:hypothetical protein